MASPHPALPTGAASTLPWRHALLALAVVAVWGSNFVVIHAALEVLPPLLLAALRYALAFLPAALLLPRPALPWRLMASYGLLIGLGQFGLLFIAMNGHIAPGLASLVVQTQVFFTIGLVMWLEGERVRPYQWLALLLAAIGLGVIAWHVGGWHGGASAAEGGVSAKGLLLVLLAALAWAGGNVVSRRAGRINMLGFVVWSSAWAVPPLLLLSLWLEGLPAITSGLARADLPTWLAVAWQSLGNTLFGYAAWGWLLSRHAAAQITPWALLVPVFGMGASALLLGEPLQPWKLLAAGLVLAGLGLTVWWPRWRRGAPA